MNRTKEEVAVTLTLWEWDTIFRLLGDETLAANDDRYRKDINALATKLAEALEEATA